MLDFPYSLFHAYGRILNGLIDHLATTADHDLETGPEPEPDGAAYLIADHISDTTSGIAADVVALTEQYADQLPAAFTKTLLGVAEVIIALGVLIARHLEHSGRAAEGRRDCNPQDGTGFEKAAVERVRPLSDFSITPGGMRHDPTGGA